MEKYESPKSQQNYLQATGVRLYLKHKCVLCSGLDLIPEVPRYVHLNIPKSKIKSEISNTSVPEHFREEISDCTLIGELSRGMSAKGVCGASGTKGKEQRSVKARPPHL